MFISLSPRQNSWRQSYKKLKTKNSPSVKYEYLPEDFTINGWKVVDEFAEKTVLSENEWMLYSDYTTGEIQFCFEGTSDNVSGDI